MSGVSREAEHYGFDLLTSLVGYKYFVSSDAGATDRLFKNFLTCGVNDYGCVTEQCLTAGNDVEVSGGFSH